VKELGAVAVKELEKSHFVSTLTSFVEIQANKQESSNLIITYERKNNTLAFEKYKIRIQFYVR